MLGFAWIISLQIEVDTKTSLKKFHGRVGSNLQALKRWQNCDDRLKCEVLKTDDVSELCLWRTAC